MLQQTQARFAFRLQVRLDGRKDKDASQSSGLPAEWGQGWQAEEAEMILPAACLSSCLPNDLPIPRKPKEEKAMKKTPPTDKKIQSEIEALKKMKPHVLPCSAFGDDHHQAIDAQIKTLNEGLDEYAIDDEWPDEEQDHERSSALQAFYWATGEEPISPTENWKPLIQK